MRTTFWFIFRSFAVCLAAAPGRNGGEQKNGRGGNLKDLSIILRPATQQKPHAPALKITVKCGIHIVLLIKGD